MVQCSCHGDDNAPISWLVVVELLIVNINLSIASREPILKQSIDKVWYLHQTSNNLFSGLINGL